MTRAAEWSGPVGDAWAQEWRRTDLSFSGLAPHLDAAILAAAPDSGSAMDIGCGAGATSLSLAAAKPDLSITGLDVSPELVAVANDRAAGHPNLRFVTADLNTDSDIAAPGSVDLVVSRHGVMFFDDPTDAFTRLHHAARPGAALVFSCFRAPSFNPWATELVADLTGAAGTPQPGYAPGPFGFADPAIPTAALEAAGWHSLEREPVDFLYIAGQGDNPVAEAVAFFRRIGPVAAAIKAAPDPAAMTDRLATLLDRYTTGDIVAFSAAAWLWRATA